MEHSRPSGHLLSVVALLALAFVGCASPPQSGSTAISPEDLQMQVASQLEPGRDDLGLLVRCDGSLHSGQEQSCAVTTKTGDEVHIRVRLASPASADHTVRMTPYLTPELVAEAINDNVRGRAHTKCTDELTGRVGAQISCQVKTEAGTAKVRATVTAVRDLKIEFKIGR